MKNVCILYNTKYVGAMLEVCSYKFPNLVCGGAMDAHDTSRLGGNVWHLSEPPYHKPMGASN